MKRAAIVSPVRTPVGKFLGSLSSVTAGDLGAVILKALVERSGINPEKIDDVIFAQGYANGEAPCIARWSALAAGLPISAEGAASLGPLADAGAPLWLDRRLFSPRPDYLLRVQGDSMIDDGIVDGDLVGVQHTPEARDGQTVVARVDGELTIKRLQNARGRILLLPRNRAYAPIEVGPGQDFAIEGVYCGLLRRG